jgi:serine/threonine-protein kinase
MTAQTTGRQALADILGTRFQIVSKLGSGAFGEVYMAYDTTLDRNVAIKRVRLDALADETQIDEVKARFLREARVAAQLKHPNIVTIHDIVSASTTSFIVMELIDGVTLQSVLQSKKRLGLQESIDILSQAADALDYAHQNKTVHRDIKPANIMIESTGRVKVTDFGIAKTESSGNLTATGSILGTPNYMSPEQAQGKPLDGRSDLFSLGCVLYECLTGRKPFHGDNVTAILLRILSEKPSPIDYEKMGLSPALDDVMERALAKNPDERYSSGAELFRSMRSLPSAISPDQTIDLGPTRVSPPLPAGTHRRPAPDETVPTAPPASPSQTAEAPATIRRTARAPQTNKKLRPLWAVAALLILATLAGAFWWSKRPRLDDKVETLARNSDAVATDEGPRPVTSSPTQGEGGATDTPSDNETPPSEKPSALSSSKGSEDRPSLEGSRAQPGPPASKKAASPKSGPPRDGIEKSSIIEKNEKAAVERLTRLSQVQAQFKAEKGRYATARDLMRRRRAASGARLRGNQWMAQGYRFFLEVPRPDFYFVLAVPINYGQSGIHSFYLDARGVIHRADKQGARATASDPIWR